MLREVLLLESNNPKFASVVRAHDFLWLSSVDGVYKVGTFDLDEEAFSKGPAQAANAYSEIVRRLEECGVSGSAPIRIEHATASQDWRLQRMALWPNHFGLPTTAVSQGYQGKMIRQNMITVGVVAAMPNVARELISPGPNSGRASRVTRAADFVFIIGVRGEVLLSDGTSCSDGLIEHTEMHIDRSMANIDFHLAAAGLSGKDLVRIDAFLRSPQDAVLFRKRMDAYMKTTGGRFSINAFACPLGGSTDIEISAIASCVSQGITKKSDVSKTNLSVVSSGFGFISTCLMDSGNLIEASLPSTIDGQFELGLNVLKQRVSDLGSNASIDDIVRLDIFLTSPYTRPVVEELLIEAFNGSFVPPVVWHGSDLPEGLQIDVSAVIAIA